jgi:hypothetical protein
MANVIVFTAERASAKAKQRINTSAKRGELKTTIVVRACACLVPVGSDANDANNVVLQAKRCDYENEHE